MAKTPIKEVSQQFAMHKKTWLLLYDLSNLFLQTTSKKMTLKDIAHIAVEEYYDKVKKRKVK